MVARLPQDVIARLRAMDPAITPELAQASWALLTPFHEKPAGAEDVAAAVGWLRANIVWVDGHSHMSAVGSLGVDEAALGVPPGKVHRTPHHISISPRGMTPR